MVGEILTTFDVSTDQFALDLKALSEEIRGRDAHCVGAEANHVIGEDDAETVELTITVVPTKDSRFRGGYNIPMRDNMNDD